MNRIAPLVLVLAACLAAGASAQEAPAAAQQAKPSAEELDFRHQLMLDDYARVEYRDEAGNAITFEDILRAIPTGKSFSIDKDKARSLATVKLGGSRHGRADEPAPQSLQVGQALPAPEGLRTLDGNGFGSDELRGRRTLLSFYFAECLPCIEEIPELNRFAAAHPEMGVYAVTFDDAATAKAFVAQSGLKLPVVADAQPYLDALGVQTYPTLVLVDKQGKVAAVRHGGKVRIGESPAGSAGIDEWVVASASPAAAAAH